MKQIRTILLTTDLTEQSQKAVESTLTLARKFEAKIVLTYVGDLFLPSPDSSYLALDIDRLKKELHEHGRQQLTEWARKHLSGFDVELEVPLGVPDIEIVNLARRCKADLIVMAPHGRGFISHLILGSTTERVVRRAPCPVLVVREPAAA
jgi:nucleotide-binding universal stress UspA family protein